MATLLKRFMNFVRSDWQWVGGKNKYGYGAFYINHKSKGAHCISYELFNGPIPEGMCVLHSCDDPGCVNPECLHLGTKKDNTHEMMDRRRNKHIILTKQSVEEIKTLLAQRKYKQREIASMYGVKNSTIGMISSGKNWSDK